MGDSVIILTNTKTPGFVWPKITSMHFFFRDEKKNSCRPKKSTYLPSSQKMLISKITKKKMSAGRKKPTNIQKNKIKVIHIHILICQRLTCLLLISREVGRCTAAPLVKTHVDTVV